MRNRQTEVVYIPDEGVLGVLSEVGPYFSKVWFFKEGLEFELLLENDEFILMEEVEESD